MHQETKINMGKGRKCVMTCNGKQFICKRCDRKFNSPKLVQLHLSQVHFVDTKNLLNDIHRNTTYMNCSTIMTNTQADKTHSNGGGNTFCNLFGQAMTVSGWENFKL